MEAKRRKQHYKSSLHYSAFKSLIARFSITGSNLIENLSNAGRSRKQAISILVDSAMACFCLWLAYSIRLDELYSSFSATWPYFIFVGAFTPIVFASLGIYRWIIRTSNTRSLKQLIKASAIIALALLVVMFLIPVKGAGSPRSLFLIFGLFLTTTSIGIRLLWQQMLGVNSPGSNAEPVAVYGAGVRGQELASMLQLSKESRVVLFLDDNPALAQSTVAGVPVVNPGAPGLGANLIAHEVNRVILASQHLDRAPIQRLLRSASGNNISVQTLPTINEVIAGQALAGVAREITLGDLLGRDEVPPDSALLSASVTGKNVLITGGGGSIGSEICLQCLQLMPRSLVVLDQSEENLYRVTETVLAAQQADNSLSMSVAFEPILGSVCDRQKVSRIVSQHQINTVFHAAAYKHVPIVEKAVGEGYRVNVIGTKTVLEESIAARVEKFVLISTDKAVRPTNVMGATKRIAELVLQAYALENSGTSISMVRFGNVLGSSGSVVPKFKSQIDQGGPISLTHPDITRYFMSIPEASQLVLQAASLSRGGEVFVLDMGESVKIIDLARAMIELSGLTERNPENPNGDIGIEIIGLRPGEKLFEEMFIGADSVATEVRKIFVARETFLPLDNLLDRLATIQESLDITDYRTSKTLLMSLVADGSESTTDDYCLVTQDKDQNADKAIQTYTAELSAV